MATRFNRRAVLAGLGGVVLSPHSAKGDGIAQFGFILVGAGWCAVCKNAAPLLYAFAQRQGVPVLVASQDLQPIPPFVNVMPTEGHPIANVVRRFPTVLAVRPASMEVAYSFEGYRNPTWFLRQLQQGASHARNLS